MNDNVRKIFDLLSVEPNEIFKVDGYEGCRFVIEDNLAVCKVPYSKDFNYFKWFTYILNNPEHIIKLPKELKEKKLRDLTPEEYKKWLKKNCSNLSCEDCVFLKAKCNINSIGCWINHKDAYSDKFLNQEIEVE